MLCLLLQFSLLFLFSFCLQIKSADTEPPDLYISNGMNLKVYITEFIVLLLNFLNMGKY